MSKKSKLVESQLGKSLLASFVAFIVSGQITKANKLKQRVKDIDKETGRTLDQVGKDTRSAIQKYRSAVKNMSPEEKAEFDKKFKFEYKKTMKKVLGL